MRDLQAVAANLARIGVQGQSHAQRPRSATSRRSFARHQLLPARLDPQARSTLTTPSRHHGDAHGERPRPVQLGLYSNPRLDELTLKVQSETDEKKRNDMIREAFKIHQDDVGHIPLHQQALAWA
jgi:peptide/nickel transport system substrate-binding protein